MELPPAVPLSAIGDIAETEVDIGYRRYCDWCASIGISDVAPLWRWSKYRSKGNYVRVTEGQQARRRNAYERKREASRVEIERRIAAL
jgi:hypothetical protein